MGAPKEQTIKNWAGVNLKDAADKVADNEVLASQNCYQPSKGSFFNRFGSVLDQPAATFPLASRISGVWRHYSVDGDRFSLYHCVPNSSLLPDNTVDLTLSEIADTLGNIFGGGGIVALRVCYSWIGAGLEQTYNSRNRAGFPAVGSFPLNASANPAHQTITLGSASSTLSVVVPAFPSGVRGANIFVARGTATQMVYMGSVTTSGGQILVREFIGPVAANSDQFLATLPSSATMTAYTPSGTDVTTALNAYNSATAFYNAIYQKDLNLGLGPPAIVPGTDLGNAYNAMIVAKNTYVSTQAAAAGLLTTGTTYDAKVVQIDNKTGLILAISPVFSGVSGTAVLIGLPLVGATPNGSYLQLFFGTHSGTLFLVPQAQIVTGNPATGITFTQSNALPPGGTVVVSVLPTSGQTAPAAPGGSNQQPFIGEASFAGGTLTPGNYWVGFSWVCDTNNQEGSGGLRTTKVQCAQQLTLINQNASIGAAMPSLPSVNGAQSIYVFVGTQDPTKHPMTCVGIGRAGGDDFAITAIPSHNAQTSPTLFGPDKNSAVFWNGVSDGLVGGTGYQVGQAMQARFAFMLARKNDGAVTEIFPSRTHLTQVFENLQTIAYQGDYYFQGSQGAQIQLHNWAPQPKSQNDLYVRSASTPPYIQPYAWSRTVNDPSFCYQLGMSYFANGADIPWQTDGYTLGQLSVAAAVNQTLLPPPPKYIFVFQNSLIAAGNGNQVYASNANQPFNWAVGGDGPAVRFVTIGDAVGSGVTASGIFTPQTEATSNPGSFLIGFKKIGVWMVNGVPDPVAGIGTPMVQISGRAGCVAYRSIAQTPIGTVFMGQDANVYLIRSVAEPVRIGTKIQNALKHLVGNDVLMRLCTATYHDNHYKLSFPSAAIVAAGGVIYCDSEYWADLRTEGGDPIKWFGPMVGRSVGCQIVLAGDQDDLSRLVADGSQIRTYTADSITTLSDLSPTNTAQSVVKQVKSKQYRGGLEAHLKRILGANLDMYLDFGFTNEVLVEFFADSFYQQVDRIISSGGAIWDASNWDGSNWADAEWFGRAFLLGTNISGRTGQFQITHSNSAPFALAAVTLITQPENRRMVE